MKLHSVRFKISVLFTTILGIILLAYSLLLYYSLNQVIFREIDANLKIKVIHIEDIIKLYSDIFDADKDDASFSLRRALHLEEQENNELFQWPSVKKLDQMWRYTIRAMGIKNDYIVVYTTSGDIVEKSANISPELLSILQNGFSMTSFFRTNIRNLPTKNEELRVITRPFYRAGKIKYVIQLATPTESHKILQKNKAELITLTIPIFLLATSFLGVFFVNHILKPVKQITRAAQQISLKDLDKRIQLQHTDEEIRALVDAFNDMISRLEKSFHHIEQFSSDVAHELKTPLAIIRGELEVALRKERPPEEYQRAIRVSLEEVQRVLTTVNDLLLLAKLDYRTEVLKFETLNLNIFLEEIFAQSKLMAANKKITMTFKPSGRPLNVAADKLHLRRLFRNLLDNAIKYTPSGGRVDVRATTQQANQAKIIIRDTGVGISAEELPKIFDRFYHSQKLNQTASSGIGLSLVQSIAKIHNGRVTASSQPGQGSAFTVFLPLA